MDVLASKWLLQDEALPDLLSQTTCNGPDWSDINVGIQLLNVLEQEGMDKAITVLDLLVKLTEPPHELPRSVVYLSLENLVLASGSTDVESIWQFVEGNEDFLCHGLEGLKPPGSTLLRTINVLEALARSSQNYLITARVVEFSEKVFGVRERFPHKHAVRGIHMGLNVLSSAQQTLVEDGWARSDKDLTKLLDEIESGTKDMFQSPFKDDISVAGAQTKAPIEIAAEWHSMSRSSRVQICLAVIFMLQRIQHRRAELKTPASECDERVKDFRLSWYRQLLGVSDKLCLSVVNQIMHSERYWLDWECTKKDEKSPGMQQPKTVDLTPAVVQDVNFIDRAIAERKATGLESRPPVSALDSRSPDVAALVKGMQSIDEPDIVELYQWVLQRMAVDNPQHQDQVDLAIPPAKRMKPIEEYFAIVQDKLQKEQVRTYDSFPNDQNAASCGGEDYSESDYSNVEGASDNERLADESMNEERDDEYSPNDDGYSPNDDSYPPNDDSYSPNDDSYSPNDDGYSPNDDGHSPNDDGHSPSDDGYSPDDDGYSPTLPDDDRQDLMG